MTRRTPGGIAAVPAVVLAALLLTGCGGEAPGSAPEFPAALTETAGPLPTTPAKATPVLPAIETGTPTLPPGDPGTDSAAPPRADDPEHPPRTDVPADALLDAQTLSAVLGAPWRPSTAAPPEDSCATPRPRGAVATRAAEHRSTSGRLVQAVAVHPSEEGAEDAVTTLTERLTRCGWTVEEAPRIGEAAAQLGRRTSSGTERVVAVAVEGVSVTLVASGPTFDTAETLAAVVDVAVSSSCPAAADGCH